MGRPLGSLGRLSAALRERRGAAARGVVFFAMFYVYLWRGVEPHLLFHGAGVITNFPSFYTSRAFLQEHLSYPGGPIEYLSAFLSQWFYHSWLGALVVTLQAWAVCLCVAHLLRGTKWSRVWLVSYVPALLLAIIYGRYTYHFPTTMAMLVALALACAYLALARYPMSPRIHLTVFIVLALVGYFVAAGAVLLFVSLCALHELLFANRWRLGLFYGAAGAMLPYVGGVLGCGVGALDAYTRLLPISWRVLRYAGRSRLVTIVYALYLLAPALMATGLAWPMLWVRLSRHCDKVREAREKKGHRKGKSLPRTVLGWYSERTKVRWVVQTLVVVGASAGVALAGLDQKKKTRFAADYYAYHRQWPEVLAEGRKCPDNRFVMHAVDRALYHTGRLGDEMFRWPQDPEYLFLMGTGRDWVHWQSFDVHLDLGLVNMAEHSLTESLEALGDRPMVLQRLAMVNMVKGDIDTARVFLGALDRTLFHHGWARHYLELLRTDPTLSTDAHVQDLRSVALERDFPLLDLSKEKLLLSLLERNGKNRMAFEYLMAWYLLNKQLGRFTEHIDKLREVGYSELPRYFEEAILVYVYGTRKAFQLSGYEPRAEADRQMEHFSKILERHGGKKQAAFAELATQHRDTYLFYYMYAQPGRAK